MTIDPLFLGAVGAFGWGASLAGYRLVATRVGWPMGTVQARAPALTIGLGVVCMIAAGFDCLDRIDQPGVATLAVLGSLFAVFWIGFMRVASQVSLFLAPAATLLLILDWIGKI